MFPALLALAGAAQTAGNILQAGSGFAQAGMLRSQNRQRMRLLRDQAELATMQGTAEGNRVRDQLDDVTNAQAGYFAANNIDPTWGSPAFLAAESAAQAEMDILTAGARGQQRRADAFQQIANLEAQNTDASRAAIIGAGSAFLNTVSQWASLGLQAGRMAGGGGSAPAASGPMLLAGGGQRGGSGGGWGGWW